MDIDNQADIPNTSAVDSLVLYNQIMQVIIAHHSDKWTIR